MEKNPSGSNVPTPMGSIDIILGMSGFDPKGFSTPKQTQMQPQTTKVEMVYIEDTTNKPHKFIPKEILEMHQDPYLIRALDAMLWAIPNQYMLKLVQEVSKLPANFNVDTLKEQSFASMAQNHPCENEPLVHYVIQQMPQPPLENV